MKTVLKLACAILSSVALSSCGEDQNAFSEVQAFQGNTDISKLQKDFPFAVLVSNSAGRAFCSGTLVAPDLVITASHCISGGAIDSGSGVSIETVLGEKIGVEKGEGIPTKDVNVFIEGIDFGYLKLKSKVQKSKVVAKIASPDQIDKAKGVGGSLDLVSVGVGETKILGAARSGVFNFLETEFMTVFGPLRDRKNFEYQSGNVETTDAVFSEFLAGGFGHTACSGDSGGGAFAKLKTWSSVEYVLVGLVSRGIGYREVGSEGVACGERVSEVYTFAHAGKEWLESKVGLLP